MGFDSGRFLFWINALSSATIITSMWADYTDRPALQTVVAMPKFAANLSFLFADAPFPERFRRGAAAGFTGVEYLFPYEWSGPRAMLPDG